MSTVANQHTPIIAIDFDGTIVEHAFPGIGTLKPGAKEVINKWYDMGYHIIIWTCRNMFEPIEHNNPAWENATIGAVTKFLKEQGVKFTNINMQQPGLGFYLTSPKIFANIYIDDRNLGGFQGWDFIDKAVENYYASDDGININGWKNYLHYLNAVPESKTEEAVELLQYFVDRVEAGTIRSRTTYKKYKDFLSKYQNVKA